MNIRKIAFAAVTIAAFSPLIANASPEKASVKACAAAFASTVSTTAGTAPGYKLAYRSSFGSALADFYPTEYTFTMDARDPKTGTVISHAVCSADSHGTVTAITTTPVEAKNTTLASRN
jgi:hypothetical protein